MNRNLSDFSETIPLSVRGDGPDDDAPHTSYRRVDRLTDAAAMAVVVLLALTLILPGTHAGVACAFSAVLIHLCVPDMARGWERRLALDALERAHRIVFLHVGFDGMAEWERDGDVFHGVVRWREGRAWLMDETGLLV